MYTFYPTIFFRINEWVKSTVYVFSSALCVCFLCVSNEEAKYVAKNPWNTGNIRKFLENNIKL